MSEIKNDIYDKLFKLVPDFNQKELSQVRLKGKKKPDVSVSIGSNSSLTKRPTYNVSISNYRTDNENKLADNPLIHIHVFHDTKEAEVATYSSRDNFIIASDKFESKLSAQEKIKLNQYLNNWLGDMCKNGFKPDYLIEQSAEASTPKTQMHHFLNAVGFSAIAKQINTFCNSIKR